MKKIYYIGGSPCSGKSTVAAYLPELMMKIGVDKKRYVNITPTKYFQYLYYRRRPFVPYVLEGCKDKAQAFENWMERDILFAQAVKRDAISMGYSILVTDGDATIDETYHCTCRRFGLEEEAYGQKET